MNGLFYVWMVREFGMNGEALLLMAFCSSLIVITFIDIDHQIIPDAITPARHPDRRSRRPLFHVGAVRSAPVRA